MLYVVMVFILLLIFSVPVMFWESVLLCELIEGELDILFCFRVA